MTAFGFAVAFVAIFALLCMIGAVYQEVKRLDWVCRRQWDAIREMTRVTEALARKIGE